MLMTDGKDLSKSTRVLKVYVFTGTIHENVESVDDDSKTYVLCKFNGEERKITPKQGKYPIYGEGIY
jgi:hypothetical protein